MTNQNQYDTLIHKNKTKKTTTQYALYTKKILLRHSFKGCLSPFISSCKECLTSHNIPSHEMMLIFGS